MESHQASADEAWVGRSRDPEAKREAVLAAAAHAFAQAGYAATTIDDIAARLGVSKPTVYYYTGSKQALLGACFTVALDAYSQAVDSGAVSTGDGRTRLEQVVHTYVEITTTAFGRCLHRVPDVELTVEVRDRLRAVKRQVDGRIRELLREGILDGSLRTRDVRMTTFALSGAMNSIAQWYSPDGKLTPAEIGTRIWEGFSEGIRPR